MVNMSMSSRCQIGLDFFEFLKETDRTSIRDRIQLRDIYNNEFRSRNVGSKDPNFGSVLYALKTFNKITRRRDNISFNSTVKALYVDQWQTQRSRHPQPVQNGEASPSTEQVLVSASEADMGVRARRKLASQLMNKLKTDRVQFISDKQGICITSDQPFENGKLGLCVENTYEYKITLTVKNTGKEPVHFTYYTPLHWIKYLALLDDYKVTKQNPLTIGPGDSYQIKVHFRCDFVGFYAATLAFEFKPDLQAPSNEFYIVRFIEAQCITSLGLELAPVAPYKPTSIPVCAADTAYTIVDGQKPDGQFMMSLNYEVILKKYLIPSQMNQFINLLKQCPHYSDRRKTILESPLSWENYTEKFQLLLYLEELQMEVDIRRYNIPNSERDNAVMTKDKSNKKLHILELPGVSENRPSVLRGDEILVYPQKDKSVKYRGYVHSVLLDHVKLGFSSQFPFIEGMKFNVEFTINRLTLRLQHRAAEFAATHNLENVLFPAAPPSNFQQLELPKLRLFDSKLENNPEQFRAVQNIVTGSSKPAPYLVFGPPGTGKTVTMVEAIKQVEQMQPFCHILACAPSNSAADLLCEKIVKHVDMRHVYRMYATSRDPKLVSDKIKECSNLVGECYIYPAKEKLMEYRIIVTTLLTAGRLITGGIPVGHFTHVFVDEAGHAVETECLIPLAGLLNAVSGQVVLAGDPKQLGPILRSPFAIKYGMGVSLLERLMNDFSVYQKDEEGTFNSRYVTKLLRNYRSHPAILKIPNELFYDGELQVWANEMTRNSYCRWECLPKKGFPLIFHGVIGVDMREASSPSFFNVAEVELLMFYVKKLLETQGKKGLATLKPEDIGIIAPYRKQVQKIRKALEKVGAELRVNTINDLKVGSVEEFQGQERKVILVSTVRSSHNYTEIDRKFSLGFVKNEKRFNVAVTRAKALLIVVGNPLVLQTDPTWARFIQYCREEKGYTGYERAEEDDDVVERLAALSIKIETQVETAESVVQQQLDPEWRNDI
ncbi:putative helicase mov-10-B.1 [Parambassis ranga]|uniref:RNA helicase n=1 Tax=Parambassis ranga TaxID=210632 RepID=A0A6P7IS66_9TELE|nr:putative helicase mov-10-B.1 [Parambassis ranga]